MTSPHRVAVVFDQAFQTSVPSLACRCHVWLVDSAENTAAAQEYWRQNTIGSDDLTSGVTTFARVHNLPNEALASALELVEDHHGELVQAPPLGQVLVIGLDSTERVRAVLEDWGYSDVKTTDEGLLATRPPAVPETDIVRLDTASNLVVVQLPERRLPGVVVQGDSLRNMARIASCAAACIRDGDIEEGADLAEELANLLEGYVSRLDQVCPH